MLHRGSTLEYEFGEIDGDIVAAGNGMSVLAIGQRVRRDEDFRLLTGRGRYVEDVPAIGANGEPPGRGYVVRSPHAHARIVSIDAERAGATAGVLAVLTGAELERRGL